MCELFFETFFALVERRHAALMSTAVSHDVPRSDFKSLDRLRSCARMHT
jgi:hypothetical protein